MGKRDKRLAADVVEVPHADEMDDETFLNHLERRHAKETKIEKFIVRSQVPLWVGMYRIFHERLHAIAVPGQHDHYHARRGEF